MKRTSLGTIFLAAVAIGCDDSSTGPASPADLVGTWNASSYVVTNAANAEQSLDLIQMGMTMTLTFTETTLTGTMTFPGEDGQESFTGTYSLSGNQITFSDQTAVNADVAAEDDIFAFTLDGNALSLSFTEMFFFDGSEEEVTATSVMTFTRA